MPLIIAKLLSAETKDALDAAIAAYKAGAGAALATAQRGMAASLFMEGDGDYRHNVCLFHGGLAIPSTGNKTAALQHVNVVHQGTIAHLQAAIDAALAQVEHARVTDAVTTVAGHVTSATAAFATEDVGRIIEIAGVQKLITVRNSATDVSYDNAAGNFASGTGLTMKMLGAEVLQDAHLAMMKSRSATHLMYLVMACEGEAA